MKRLLILAALLAGAFTGNAVAFEAWKEKISGIFNRNAPLKGLLDKFKKATQNLNYNNPKLNEAVENFNHSLSEVEIALRIAIEKHVPQLQEELNQLYAKGDSLAEITQLLAKEKNIKILADFNSLASKSRDRILQLLKTIRDQTVKMTREEKTIAQYLIDLGEIILSKYELMIASPVKILNMEAIAKNKKELNELIYFMITGQKKSAKSSDIDIFPPNMSVASITKAWKKLLLDWHPDSLKKPNVKNNILNKLAQMGYYSADDKNLEQLLTEITQYINDAKSKAEANAKSNS